jgi:hypothetical protein
VLTNPLVLTVLLECLALFLMKENSPLFFLYWTAATSLTNVLINLYLLLLFSGSTLEYWITVAILECLVLIAEYLLCFLYTKDRKTSAKYSLVCNGVSFTVGLFIL